MRECRMKEGGDEGKEQRGRRRWAAGSSAAAEAPPPPVVAPPPSAALSGKAQRGCLHGVQRCSSAHLRLHTISARLGAAATSGPELGRRWARGPLGHQLLLS